MKKTHAHHIARAAHHTGKAAMHTDKAAEHIASAKAAAPVKAGVPTKSKKK